MRQIKQQVKWKNKRWTAKRYVALLNSKSAKSLCAFFVPVIIMLIILAIQGIWPFRKPNSLPYSILTMDLDQQYISFFSYYQETLKGNADIAYSFSKTLGGDMVGLWAYYLMSPLNLLLLFFSTAQLPIGITFLFLVKIGFCGLTFQLFLSHKKPDVSHNEHKSPWSVVLFGSVYALTGYLMAYHFNIMWIDGIMLFPLVLWGIHRIFEGKSVWLYLCSLGAALITNYYMGYMLCIFSVLYFFYCLISLRKGDLTYKALFLRYALSSFGAGGLSAWLLLPVFCSLEGGKAAFDLVSLTMEPNFYWSDIISQGFIGSFNYEAAHFGLPPIFCGTISLLFVVIYFLSPRISLRKKAGAGFVLLIMLLSFYFRGLDLLWHGMNPPSWFPYRYSFIFTGFLLILAFEGWQASKWMVKWKERWFPGLGVVVVMGGVFLWMWRKQFSVMTNEKYLMNALVLFGGLLFFFALGSRFRKSFYMLLSFLLISEMLLNGYYSMSTYLHYPKDVYVDFVNAVQPAVKKVKSMDQGFYRMEKTFSRKECDPMLLNYRGLSHFSSTEKHFTKDFMWKLGFRRYHRIWSYYNDGSTFAADAFLGVKYILSETPIGNGYELLDKIKLDKAVDFVRIAGVESAWLGKLKEIQIYQNKYALPLGFMVSGDITHSSLKEKNTFKFQNNIWRAMSTKSKLWGTGDKLFQALDIKDVKLHNLKRTSTDNEVIYTKMQLVEPAYLEYHVVVSDENPVFAFFLSYSNDALCKKVNIEVNGVSRGEYFSAYNYNVLRLGEGYKKGEIIKIRLTLLEDDVCVNEAWVYSQNMEVFQNYYQELAEGGMEISSFTDSEIKGRIRADGSKPYAMFTIPYETGWKAFVDGKAVETFASLDTFLTIPIGKGEHDIQLKYTPPGMKMGMLISIGSLLSIIYWILWKKHHTRKVNVMSYPTNEKF